MSVYKQFSTLITPQTELLPRQSRNNAGGGSFTVDKWERLERFLVLGSEGGTYYVKERKLTEANAQVVLDCIAEDGPRAVTVIAEISVAGRAPRNTPAIFALALAASKGDDATRVLALEAMPAICRTGTHLFQFVSLVRNHRGTGRGLRRAIANWYENKNSGQLAYQVIKYRQREGYTHRDLLRLAHPKTPSPSHDALYGWLTGKDPATKGLVLPPLVEGYRAAQDAQNPEASARLVREYGLPWEALKTEHLNSREVWEALIESGLPMTALLRNLNRLSDLFDPLSEVLRNLCAQLTDEERLRRARVHPFNVLTALKTYASGRGFRGSKQWTVHPMLVDALDAAFYKSFAHVEPTGKRTFLSLDVSSSMHGNKLLNSNVNAAEGSCAMAMVTAQTEPYWLIGAFAREFTIIGMSPKERLDDLVSRTQRLGFGGTDCALPMVAAAQQGWDIDTFVIYTDSETWAGPIHPVQALDRYRKTMNKPQAKLVVVGMTSTQFTIADPRDPLMLDVVGFDSACPSLINQFSMN